MANLDYVIHGRGGEGNHPGLNALPVGPGVIVRNERGDALVPEVGVTSSVGSSLAREGGQVPHPAGFNPYFDLGTL